MMRTFDSRELVDLVPGSSVTAPAEVSGISTDTRTLVSGDAYVALRGTHFDGHTFNREADQAGASLLVVDHPETLPTAQWLVADTRQALGALGRFNRRLSRARLVAVTGSSGKTTTKEITAALLNACAPTLATRGNLNNDIGVPKTLLEIAPQHEFAVVELGANHLGEIAYTTNLAEPDVAVVLNAGSAHLAEFGSRRNIRRAKGEILDGLGPAGVAVLNRDDPAFDQWAARAPGRVVSFGQHAEAEVRVQPVNHEAGQQLVQIASAELDHTVVFPLPGAHNLSNLAAAVAVMVALRLPAHLWLPAVSDLKTVAGRLHEHRFGPWKVIDDTYNASPESVKAAIDVLATAAGPQVLVLGELGELGAYARRVYREVGEYARQRIHSLWTIGDAAADAARAFGESGRTLPDNAAAQADLIRWCRAGAGGTVLIKGSRAAQLDHVLRVVLDDFHAQGDH